MTLDAELKARLELADAEERFIAAKKNRAKDPAAYNEAKASLHKIRTTQRRDRESVLETIDTKVI
jgi:hypothetical protein